MWHEKDAVAVSMSVLLVVVINNMSKKEDAKIVCVCVFVCLHSGGKWRRNPRVRP